MFNRKRPNGVNINANDSARQLDEKGSLQKQKGSSSNAKLAIIFITFALVTYSISSYSQRSKSDESFEIPNLRKSHPSSSAVDKSHEKPKISIIPEGFENSSYHKIRTHFDCRSHAHDQAKPLHSLESWQLFRTTYIETVVANYDTTIDTSHLTSKPIPPTQGYAIISSNNDPHGPPFTASFSPGKGRGLFASQNIQKGQLVHDGRRSKVTFPNASAWRQFVFALPDRKMACDIAEWSWTQKLEGNDNELLIHVDLNISAFMNSGGGSSSNVGPLTNDGVVFYALRDIEKGEEILYNYSVYETNWKAVGL